MWLMVWAPDGVAFLHGFVGEGRSKANKVPDSVKMILVQSRWVNRKFSRCYTLSLNQCSWCQRKEPDYI